MVPLPAKLSAVPPVTETSSIVKPVTSLLNVAVTVNGETFVGSVTGVDSANPGAIASYSMLSVAAVLPFPAASVAASAPTSIVTNPWPAGVTSNV